MKTIIPILAAGILTGCQPTYQSVSTTKAEGDFPEVTVAVIRNPRGPSVTIFKVEGKTYIITSRGGIIEHTPALEHDSKSKISN